MITTQGFQVNSNSFLNGVILGFRNFGHFPDLVYLQITTAAILIKILYSKCCSVVELYAYRKLSDTSKHRFELDVKNTTKLVFFKTNQWVFNGSIISSPFIVCFLVESSSIKLP